MISRTSTAIAGLVLALIAMRSLAAQQLAPPRIPTSVLERYVGEWVYPDGEKVTIRLLGDTLFREVPGQRVPLVPLSETLFRLGPVFTAEFVIDQTGGITQVLTDGIVEYRLTRKGSRAAAMPAASPVPSVPRSILQRYVGVYDYIPGQMKRTDLRVVVRLKGDTLIRDIGEQQQVLTPISDTQFRVAGTSLTTEFVVDDAGVTLVMGSGGQQMLARLKPKR